MLKKMTFLIWILALVVAFYLAKSDVLLEKNIPGRIIAEVSNYQGVVQIRNQNLVLWSYASPNQGLASGSTLATGKNSVATIVFSGGRSIVIAPNTQIAISDEDGKSQDLHLTLLKGTIKTTNNQSKKSQNQSIRFSTGKTEIVSENSQDLIALNKTLGIDQPTVGVSKGKLTITNGSINVMKGDGSAIKVVEASFEESKLIVASNEDSIQKNNSKNSSPKLNRSNSGENVQTTALLNILKNTDTPSTKQYLDSINVMSDSADEENGEIKFWREEHTIKAKVLPTSITNVNSNDKLAPKQISLSAKSDLIKSEKNLEQSQNKEITISSLNNVPLINNTKVALLPDIETESGQYWTVKSLKKNEIKWFPIKLNSSHNSDTWDNEHFITLNKEKIPFKNLVAQNDYVYDISSDQLTKSGTYTNGQILLSIATGIGNNLNQNSKNLNIISLADFGKKPVYISMEAINSKPIDDEWNFTLLPESKKHLNFILHLRQGNDLIKISELLKGTKNFEISNEAFKEGENPHAVLFFKNERNIASLYSRHSDFDGIDLIEKNLQNDFSVKCNKNDIISIVSAKDKLRAGDIEKLDTAKVHILTRKKILTINNSLLINNPLAIKIINDNATAIFNKSVEITKGKE